MEEFLIREARIRQEVFEKLPEILKKIRDILSKMDKDSRAFLFGSVARGEYSLTSDVDILILTKLKPNEVIARLRKEGFDEPFEFHVVDEKAFDFYTLLFKELKEF
ncbi:MAG: nucleotidyltransferase domain-containing protein [Crenarchaeota archaeon]|nr:nucleotidyltransferase domain-containing protein [Thermoproteota archaeon]MDW8033797.1 nucleotidyltransferase domain-containing protein [Nitrososphaerota archaeon]